jgi:mono/diheme cytochrome c family protein
MRLLFIALLTAGASGCDLSMKRQPKLVAQSSATLWPAGPPVGTAPAGTIVFEAKKEMEPPAPTPALFDRGREQYRIFCMPCHGERGFGDGVIVSRGFPAPESFASPPARAASRDQIFAAISTGAGRMYGFADRLSAADRWAIVLYLRGLQALSTQGGAM